MARPFSQFQIHLPNRDRVGFGRAHALAVAGQTVALMHSHALTRLTEAFVTLSRGSS